MTWSLLWAVQYTPGRPFQLIFLVSVEGKITDVACGGHTRESADKRLQ